MAASWCMLLLLLLLQVAMQLMLATAAAAAAAAAAGAATTACEPPRCRYTAGSGIYWSTYGGPLQKPLVANESLALLDAGLGLDHIAGVSHYQNWSALEGTRGVYNWTVLDAVFAAAARHDKFVLLGLQQGVCAPRWLLEDTAVHTVRFVHANPGWYRWATLQTPPNLITFAPPWHSPAYEAAVERVVRAMAARYGSHPSLAWVNVAGPSASAGVEANFNIDWNASRVAYLARGPGNGGGGRGDSSGSFDEALNYTKAGYVDTWKRQLDLYDDAFPRSARLGMATHDQNGDFGWAARGTAAAAVGAAAGAVAVGAGGGAAAGGGGGGGGAGAGAGGGGGGASALVVAAGCCSLLLLRR